METHVMVMEPASMMQITNNTAVLVMKASLGMAV